MQSVAVMVGVRAPSARHRRLEPDAFRAAPRRPRGSGALLPADVDRAQTKKSNKRRGDIKGEPDRQRGRQGGDRDGEQIDRQGCVYPKPHLRGGTSQADSINI